MWPAIGHRRDLRSHGSGLPKSTREGLVESFEVGVTRFCQKSIVIDTSSRVDRYLVHH